MKKNLIVGAMFMLSFPIIGHAGYQNPGTVTINATGTQVNGALSVARNPATSDWIYIQGSAGGAVSITAVSGGRLFNCIVPVGSPLYSAAVDIKNSTNAASRISATSNPDNTCGSISLQNSSWYVN